MWEREWILARVEEVLGRGRDLAGRTILVTAGPTHEPIDPVRFIGNHSSGRMGYAVAREAAARGARVVLVSGPVGIAPPPGVDVVPVTTADEMLDAGLTRGDRADAVVKAAAVADWRPAGVAGQKLKKDPGAPRFE